eukprot:786857-Rhodomonas_salina.3
MPSYLRVPVGGHSCPYSRILTNVRSRAAARACVENTRGSALVEGLRASDCARQRGGRAEPLRNITLRHVRTSG